MAAANMDSGGGGLALGLGNGGNLLNDKLQSTQHSCIIYNPGDLFVKFKVNSIHIKGGGAGKSNQSIRSISPAMIPCGITDEQLVTLTVRELNKQLKMRGLNKEEMGTMKQR